MGERSGEEAAGLPAADGPLVRVRLHDGQQLYAVVKARRKERDGTWWYLLQIHLPAAVEQRGRLVDEPTVQRARITNVNESAPVRVTADPRTPGGAGPCKRLREPEVVEASTPAPADPPHPIEGSSRSSSRSASPS